MTDGDGMSGLIGAGIIGAVGLGTIGMIGHMTHEMTEDHGSRKKKEGRARNANDDMMDLLF